MKLNALKAAVTNKVGRQILTAQKNSPTILFAGGVIGVVATSVLTAKATLKLEDVLEEIENKKELSRSLKHPNYNEEDRRRDGFLITVQGATSVAKLYAPAIGVGLVSVAMLTGSHVILNKRNAAVMAAYSALDRGFNEYRDRVREELGQDKDDEFRYGTSKVTEVVEGKNGKMKEVETNVLDPQVPSIYARFFDDTSQNWSRTGGYNQIFLRAQQNYANDLLRARGHVFLNDVYDMLGLERSTAGAVVGWVKGNGDDFIDFGCFDGDDWKKRQFVNVQERSILLDFNVDGVIYDLIEGN